jgi:hypothetical protein
MPTQKQKRRTPVLWWNCKNGVPRENLDRMGWMSSNRYVEVVCRGHVGGHKPSSTRARSRRRGAMGPGQLSCRVGASGCGMLHQSRESFTLAQGWAMWERATERHRVSHDGYMAGAVLQTLLASFTQLDLAHPLRLENLSRR